MNSLVFISLALFNGLLIAGVRVTNARLGMYVSVAGASFWNHFTGFLALALTVPWLLGDPDVSVTGIPFYLYLGGLLGAVYIAVNNTVIPRIGAAKATVIVVAGQVMFGALLDFAGAGVADVLPSLLGIALVVLGMWVGYRSKLEAPSPAVVLQELPASAPGK